MKTLFLTSEIGTSVKKDGVRTPVKLENTNDFLANLKNSIKNNKLALFFASNPNTFENNDKYAGYIQTSFGMSGITFDKNIVVDGRTKDIGTLVEKADLIFLMGGLTLVQAEFFDTIKLRQLLKNYSGVVIGESAGAINMANNAYESRESVDETSQWYQGLGLTDYNVEPHFSESNTELLNQTLLPDSKIAPFIALENRSYIMINDNATKLYGNAWLFANGTYRQISTKNSFINLDENELLK